MSGALKTAKVKLVTIIASSEHEDRVVEDLRTSGASGYTIARVSGGGLHGPRTRGVWETGNIRVEALVTEDVATILLKRVVVELEGMSVIAFVQDAEAVPADHFLRT